VVFSLFLGVSYLITDVQILQDSSGSSHSHQRLSYGSQQGKIKLNQISSGPFSLSNGFGCLFVGKVDALFIFPGLVFTYVMMLRQRMRGAKLSMSTYGGNWLSSVEFSCPFFFFFPSARNLYPIPSICVSNRTFFLISSVSGGK
jgi:hypothetical protein